MAAKKTVTKKVSKKLKVKSEEKKCCDLRFVQVDIPRKLVSGALKAAYIRGVKAGVVIGIALSVVASLIYTAIK